MNKIRDFNYSDKNLTLSLDEVGDISDYIEQLEETINDLRNKIKDLEYDPRKCPMCGRISSNVLRYGRCAICE